MVRLLLPVGQQYQRAAALLADWRADGSLVLDENPHFYVYEMQWNEGPTEHCARGVVGALLVEELGRRIFPHEETMPGTRADRYAVLETTQANLDLIVALSSASELASLLEDAGPLRVEVTDSDKVTHRLYDVASDDRGAALKAAVDGASLSIADGHHRYTTSLAYAKEHGPGPWNRIMAVVAPATGSGLRVAPYHRYFEESARLEGASDAFDIEPSSPEVPEQPGSLTVVAGGSAFLLTPRADAVAMLSPPLRSASAAVARDVLYPLVGLHESDAGYSPKASDAVAAAGATGTAVLVAPVTEQTIADASGRGVRFPQKTTYFTPKPRAGLVMRVFDA